MPYYYNGTLLPFGQGFTIGEFQYPSSVLELWSREELEEIGVVWVDPPLPTLDVLRTRALVAVNARREAVFAEGFLVTTGALENLHLQLRNADDKANWMIVEKRARAAIAATLDGTPIIPIRVLENQTVMVTPEYAIEVLTGLETWGGAVMAHSWTLKDAITAASDENDLAAIDLDSGWP